MRSSTFATLVSAIGLLVTTLGHAPAVQAKDSFRICWSIYAGWMPWGYGARSGIVERWAKKYGIDIEVVQIDDYVESINQYTAGGFDGCTMTNMDALTIPAAGGVDSTALIVGDFSNGNDGVVLKGASSLAEIRGRSVNLVEFSVSHYLLARALQWAGLSERDVTLVDTADADIVAAYGSSGVDAVVTWNPLLAEVKAMPDSALLFDSASIPGEIVDMLVVNTETLAANPDLGKALAGAWYEIMDTMSANHESGIAARTAMAQASGTDLAGYEAQLASTRMFYTAKDAVAFTTSGALPVRMNEIAVFSFEHHLLGDGAGSADHIGIETPAGVVGNRSNVKLRFDPTYMQMAADGRL